MIPVILAPGEELPADCIRIAPGERDADGIPQLLFGRVDLERAPSRTQLVVTDARPVNDPVVRLTIQAGCDIAMRREYTLLMDPPPIEAPLVAAESGTRSEVPAGARPAAAGRGSARGAAAGAPRDRRSGSAQVREIRVDEAADGRERSRPRARHASRPDNRASRCRARRRPPARSAARRPPPMPRQAQSQQDLANAIEAETVVLQQRIVELTAMVDRMQQEVQAGERAQRAAEAAARHAAEEAAKQAAQASLGSKLVRWLEANGYLLAAIVGLPLLIAAGLLWKRRRDAARSADRLAARRATGGASPNVEGRPVPMLRNPPAGVLRPDAETAARAGRGSGRRRVPCSRRRNAARKPMPPAPAPAARGPQRPLAFELDFDADVRKAKKDPSP